MLEDGLRSDPKNSPLLYLELLGLLNDADKPNEYRQFREQFVRRFNAAVPEFGQFRDEGHTLDAYPSLLEHINNQWESPQVLEVLEACITRAGDATTTSRFDLAAFKELLNMHLVASQHHPAQT